MSDYQYLQSALDLTQEDDSYNNECTERKRGRKRKPADLDNFDPEAERKRILANSQERVRMNKINMALEDLRKCLPQQFQLYHRRMSKIRTLRMAMSYINALSDLIRDDDIRQQREYNEAIRLAQTASTTTATYEMPVTYLPCYPCLAGPYQNYNAIDSLYRTPDQPQHQPALIPRQLNFNVVSRVDSTSAPPPSTVPALELTPVKQRSSKRLFQKEGILHTPETAQRSLKNESNTSPFLGIRHQLELNSSFLSLTSDNSHIDDPLEPGQIPIQRTNTCHDLVNLIDGDDD